MKQTTRRRFLELAPLTGGALLLAACSPAPAPTAAPTPAPTPTATPPAAPAPMPAPTPTPAPAPASAAPPAGATATGPLVDEKEPQAAALSYVSNAARVDKAKFPAYVAGSQCSNCGLYQGAVGSAAAPCPLFPGKQVAAVAWCSAWVKKA